MAHTSTLKIDSVRTLFVSRFAEIRETLVESDGVVYYLTGCCKASAKGSGDGVVCRACYAPIDDWMGDACLASEREGLRRMLGRLEVASQLVPALRAVESALNA